MSFVLIKIMSSPVFVKEIETAITSQGELSTDKSGLRSIIHAALQDTMKRLVKQTSGSLLLSSLIIQTYSSMGISLFVQTF